MKYILNLVLFCTVSFYSFAQQPAGTAVEPLKDIDSLFLKILKDQHVAGFAVAVVKGDQVIYSKGFGYRDLEHQKPVTPNTLFAIGSSSKAFTSALLGLLQKEGKLDLDGKATTYLPQLRFYNNEMNNQLTVRDMMCHRTGLSRYDTSWYLFNSNNRDSLLYRVRYMIPTYGIREKWQYNNYMFLAQGMIAEKLTGKTWEQNIKERFFDPLNMKRSNTSIFELQKDTDSSLPYTVDQDERIKRIPYYNISGMGPAGSINSSANDMTNWLKLWIGGGRFLAKEILPSSYVRAASSSQMVMSEALPKENADIFLSNYGLGWMISSYRGHYRVEHGGNINGFSALVSFFPSDELGIVVLTNQNSSKVPETIVSSIADRMFRLSPNDWNGKLNSVKAMAKTKVNKEKKDNRFCSGAAYKTIPCFKKLYRFI